MISKENAKQKYARIIDSEPQVSLIINELIDEHEQEICMNCKFDWCGCSIQDSIWAFHKSENSAPINLDNFGCTQFKCK